MYHNSSPRFFSPRPASSFFIKILRLAYYLRLCIPMHSFDHVYMLPSINGYSIFVVTSFTESLLQFYVFNSSKLINIYAVTYYFTQRFEPTGLIPHWLAPCTSICWCTLQDKVFCASCALFLKRPPLLHLVSPVHGFKLLKSLRCYRRSSLPSFWLFDSMRSTSLWSFTYDKASLHNNCFALNRIIILKYNILNASYCIIVFKMLIYLCQLYQRLQLDG